MIYKYYISFLYRVKSFGDFTMFQTFDHRLQTSDQKGGKGQRLHEGNEEIREWGDWEK
jgi:hypothetical protein